MARAEVRPTIVRWLSLAALLAVSWATRAWADEPKQPSIDLTCWKLTLPTGPSGRPNEILAPQLSQGFQDAPHFTSDAAGLHFLAPVTGTTTRGSHYPRSELRESRPDGSLFNWRDTDFRLSQLSATLQIDQLPSTGKLVIGQIHGVENGEPLIKLQTRSGKIEVLTRDKPDGESQNYAALGADGKPLEIPLGRSFDYRIAVSNSPDGSRQMLKVAIDGREVYSQKLDSAWQKVGLYFKAGAYTQDNKGPDSEAGANTFTALRISHSNDAQTKP